MPLGLSVASVPLAPVLVVGLLLADHAFSYTGTCGPYPTDIPAFPCGFGEYVANFFEPFAMAGLLVISVLTMLVTLVLVASLWALGALVWVITRSERAVSRDT